MKQLVFALLTLASQTVCAEIIPAQTYEMNYAIQTKCAETASRLQFTADIESPAELTFLVGAKPELTPLAVTVDDVEQKLDAFAGAKQTIRVTSGDLKYYSFSEAGHMRLHISVPANKICNPSSRTTFVYSITDGVGRFFGHLRLNVVNQQAELLNGPQRQQILKRINEIYLVDFTYYLSRNFPWYSDGNNSSLVEFFSTIDPQFVFTDREVATVLTNSGLGVDVKSPGTLRLHYGNQNYLEFTSQNTNETSNSRVSRATLSAIYLNGQLLPLKGR